MNTPRTSSSLAVVCSTLLLLASTPAPAALTQFRTQVQVSTGFSNATVIEQSGGLGDTSSTLTRDVGSGLAMASADLSVSGFVPTLRTLADNSGTRAQAVAWGVQGYTNGSASPLNTTLLLNLTADVTGFNDLEARIYLFQAANFQFSFDPGTILSESSSQLWPGFDQFANNPGPTGFDVLIGNHNGPVNETRSFPFTVDPGESFYVWARLVSTADNQGVSDAFSTLTASFTNTSGLVPAATVPEPSSFALLGLGVLALLRRRR